MRFALALAALALAIPLALAAPTAAVYQGSYEGGDETTRCRDAAFLTIERSPLTRAYGVRIADRGFTTGCAPLSPMRDEFAASSCVDRGAELTCERHSGDGNAGALDRLRVWGTSGATYERSRWSGATYTFVVVVAGPGVGV